MPFQILIYIVKAVGRMPVSGAGPVGSVVRRSCGSAGVLVGGDAQDVVEVDAFAGPADELLAADEVDAGPVGDDAGVAGVPGGGDDEFEPCPVEGLGGSCQLLRVLGADLVVGE